MKKLNREKRDRIILVSLGTVVVVAAIWQMVIASQIKNRKIVDDLAIKEEQKVANAQRLIGSGSDVARNLEKYSGKLKSIENGMAAGDIYSWLIDTINKFKTAHSNVFIPQFSREVACEVGLLPNFPYKAAAFNLRGTAYFHDLGIFVADLENTFPFLRVQNVELEPAINPNTAANSKADAERLSFRMEIVVLIGSSAS